MLVTRICLMLTWTWNFRVILRNWNMLRAIYRAGLAWYRIGKVRRIDIINSRIPSLKPSWLPIILIYRSDKRHARKLFLRHHVAWYRVHEYIGQPRWGLIIRWARLRKTWWDLGTMRIRAITKEGKKSSTSTEPEINSKFGWGWWNLMERTSFLS
jgi:hypothetical protein